MAAKVLLPRQIKIFSFILFFIAKHVTNEGFRER